MTRYEIAYKELMTSNESNMLPSMRDPPKLLTRSKLTCGIFSKRSQLPVPVPDLFSYISAKHEVPGEPKSCIEYKKGSLRSKRLK